MENIELNDELVKYLRQCADGLAAILSRSHAPTLGEILVRFNGKEAAAKAVAEQLDCQPPTEFQQFELATYRIALAMWPLGKKEHLVNESRERELCDKAYWRAMFLRESLSPESITNAIAKLELEAQSEQD